MANVNEVLTSIMQQATQLRDIYGKLDALDDEPLEGNILIQVDSLLEDLLDILEENRTGE